MAGRNQARQAGAPIRRMVLPALGAGILASLLPIADQLVWVLAAMLAGIIVAVRGGLGWRRLGRKRDRAGRNTARRGRKPGTQVRRSKSAEGAAPRRRPRPKA